MLPSFLSEIIKPEMSVTFRTVHCQIKCKPHGNARHTCSWNGCCFLPTSWLCRSRFHLRPTDLHTRDIVMNSLLYFSLKTLLVLLLVLACGLMIFLELVAPVGIVVLLPWHLMCLWILPLQSLTIHWASCPCLFVVFVCVTTSFRFVVSVGITATVSYKCLRLWNS